LITVAFRRHGQHFLAAALCALPRTLAIAKRLQDGVPDRGDRCRIEQHAGIADLLAARDAEKKLPLAAMPELGALCEALRADGIARIDTACHRDNEGAWRFYARLGFRPLDEERIALLLRP